MIAAATPEATIAAAQRGALVLDVRTPEEHANGHVPGSTLMPLHLVPLRLSELDRRVPIHVICESGARAHQACAYLADHGYEVVHVTGGMQAWRALDLPVARGAASLAGRP